MNRPLCRCCGKPIAKRTETIWFGRTHEQPEPEHGVTTGTRQYVGRYERPTTRAEVARLTNAQVISTDTYGGDFIKRANVWDGETYVDQYFCKLACEASFGRSMAVTFPDYAMPAYHAAMAKQRERSPA